VSANAERIIAAEIAELAAELEGAGVVNVSHVSLHVCLVHALVRAEGTGERRVARTHFASELHMLLEQALRRVDFLAMRAHISLVIHIAAQVPIAAA